MDWRWLNAAGLAVLLIAVSPHALLAQAPRPYDGIQAGYDAWRLAEEQRQAS